MYKYSILVIENELEIANNLNLFLSNAGFLVDHAYDGDSALYRLSTDKVDAVLLDLGLPKKDGAEVLIRLRQELRLDIPVIVVSGRSEEQEKIKLLNLGADDYLTKPFSMAELVARLNTQLIRARGLRVQANYVLGALCYDPKTKQVTWRGQLIKLPPKALKIFIHLISHPTQVISKEDLEFLIKKDEDVDGAAILRGQIHILRKILMQCDCPALNTYHGIGYQLLECH